MMSPIDSENDEMDRRSFLAVAGAVPFASLGTTKSNRRKRITTRVNVKDGKTGTKKVDKRWYAQKQKVEKEIKRFRSEYGSKPGIISTGIAAREDQLGKGKAARKRLKINVGVDAEYDVSAHGFDPEEDIPDNFRGIQVDIKNSSEIHLAGEWCGDQDFNNKVPGGDFIGELDDNGNVAGVGTSAFGFDYQGENYLATANHVVGGSNEDNTGNDVCVLSKTLSGYQPEKIGTVEYSYPDRDIAYVKKTSSKNFTKEIARKDKVEDLQGYITEDGIAERVGDLWDDYWSWGQRTLETKGGLQEYQMEYSVQPDIDYNSKGIRGSADIAKGDSGGPSYDRVSSGIYLVGINAALYVDERSDMRDEDDKKEHMDEEQICDRETDSYHNGIYSAGYDLPLYEDDTIGRWDW